MAGRKKFWWTTASIFAILVACGQIVKDDSSDGTDTAVAQAANQHKPLPTLTGKTLVEAENAATELGLKFVANGLGGYGYCSDETDCYVYRMIPKAGEVVQDGGKLAVSYVTGDEWAWYKKHRKMPKVVGWSEDRADKLFDPISDIVTSDLKESSSVPEDENRVIAQSPKAGTRLRIGQKIKLTIGYNYGSYTTGGGGNYDVDVNVGGSRRGGGICSRSRWC